MISASIVDTRERFVKTRIAYAYTIATNSKYGHEAKFVDCSNYTLSTTLKCISLTSPAAGVYKSVKYV